VSSEEQAERMSIATQREFLEGYCRLYGKRIVARYEDNGVSGTVPLGERPAGRSLLEDAEAGRFGELLVYRLDRVGRSLLTVLDAQERLEAAGVALRSATEPLDTATPSGRLIFNMLASFAEYERATIRERTTHGLHRALRAGKHPGRIPYGYDIDDEGRPVVVEEEAAVVRRIFETLAAGGSIYRLARDLEAEGVPAIGWRYRGKSRQPFSRWVTASMRRMIKNPLYSGRHVVRTGSGEIERPWPAIVEPHLQRRAIEQVERNWRDNRKRGERQYLLSGLLRCEECGSRFVGKPSHSKGSRRYYYVCSRYHRPYLRAEQLEALIWSDIRRFLEHPDEVARRLREEQQREGAGRRRELLARQERLKRQLAEALKEKDRYVRLYARDMLPEEEADSYIREASERAENLRLLLQSVEADLGRAEAERQSAESAAAWLLSLREKAAALEEEENHELRRRLVRTLVEDVAVSLGDEGTPQVRIVYRFGEPRHASAETNWSGMFPM